MGLHDRQRSVLEADPTGERGRYLAVVLGRISEARARREPAADPRGRGEEFTLGTSEGAVGARVGPPLNAESGVSRA